MTTKLLKFNGKEITPETVQKTIEHYIELYKDCIKEVEDGVVKVNAPQSYCKRLEEAICELERGEFTVTFTFLQTAYWLQTGENAPFLS